MKAIQIDSKAREIREVEYSTSEELRALVGGWLELVPLRLPFSNVLYIDEEGLSKPQSGFFMIHGFHAPLCGNGVIVGREVEDDSDAGYHTEPPHFSPISLAPFIRFMDRAQFDAWGKANASEPAITFTSFGPDGKEETEVIQRMGSLFGSVPRPLDEEGGDH
jgi:hypothetical protein